MKIQCDVCNKKEASIFCSADEAALCDDCDHRVHHANKLASKHRRFSLLLPSPKQFPLCDICQEKRAFLFCQQDRAILCRDCDCSIHSVNEHTQKHNRFLLTGVKLSPNSELYTPAAAVASVTSSRGCDLVPDLKSGSLIAKQVSDTSDRSLKTPTVKTSTIATTTTASDNNGNNLLMNDAGLTSSISEYLIEMLPGWHVEDFLDSSSQPYGFCKGDDGVLPFLDTDLDDDQLCSTLSQNTENWVPEVPPTNAIQNFQYTPFLNGQIGFKEFKEATSMKFIRNWSHDGFTVPQISPQSIGHKRSRPF